MPLHQLPFLCWVGAIPVPIRSKLSGESWFTWIDNPENDDAQILLLLSSPFDDGPLYNSSLPWNLRLVSRRLRLFLPSLPSPDLAFPIKNKTWWRYKENSIKPKQRLNEFVKNNNICCWIGNLTRMNSDFLCYGRKELLNVSWVMRKKLIYSLDTFWD